MNTNSSFSGRRLSHLLRVYLGLAGVGVLLSVVYALILWSPVVTLSVVAGLIGASYIATVLSAEREYAREGEAESSRIFQIPYIEHKARKKKKRGNREALLGDLNAEYCRLRSKYGLASAQMWLAVERLLLLVYLVSRLGYFITHAFRAFFNFLFHQ